MRPKTIRNFQDEGEDKDLKIDILKLKDEEYKMPPIVRLQ